MARWTATYENDCMSYDADDWADALQQALSHEGDDTGDLTSVEREAVGETEVIEGIEVNSAAFGAAPLPVNCMGTSDSEDCHDDPTNPCRACFLWDSDAGRSRYWDGPITLSSINGYEDMADKALTAGLTDAERGAADALAERITRPRPNAFYPLFATCKVCGEKLQFDIDPGGTPGQNGDWGADGDYGCITGDDEGCDGHTPVNIRWEPNRDGAPTS